MINTRILLLLFAAGTLILVGCDKNRLGTVDTAGKAPLIAGATVSPALTNIDTTRAENGTYPVAILVSVTITDPDGPADVSTAAYSLFGPDGNALIVSGPLAREVGQANPLNFVYTASLTFRVSRASVGQFLLKLQATDLEGNASAEVTLPVTVRKNNTPPILALPGLRTLGTAGGDSTLLLATVACRDSEGLSTIRQITIRAFQTSDSSARPMYDDGSPLHGDGASGDGIFSTLLWIQPLGSPQEVYYECNAADDEGGIAVPVRRFFTNQPPSIQLTGVPDVITRPTSGAVTVRFFVRATDADGLPDIDSVYFRNLTSANPAAILMYDDGSLAAHGDSVANDGVYSRALSIDASTSPGAKEFHFYVVDKAGARDEEVRSILIN